MAKLRMTLSELAVMNKSLGPSRRVLIKEIAIMFGPTSSVKETKLRHRVIKAGSAVLSIAKATTERLIRIR